MSMLMNRIFRNTTFESNSLLTINGTVQDIDINGTIERNYEKTHLKFWDTKFESNSSLTISGTVEDV
ncbi:hypothetical protein GJ496_005929 [Pomphorhynchus laevis]|nr:hypothetical protein GJ496_005929 [Pomphorhynchus laevis]